MLKKLNSSSLFSMESHEETAGEDLPEQGVVSEAETEEVVAEATPSADVEEAGDNIAQQTPGTTDIQADDKADITAAPVVETSDVQSDDNEALTEIQTLSEQGAEAAQTKSEIVETAISEATGTASGDTDINGNAITDEQAEENNNEEEIVEEVDEEASESAADKNIHQQAADVEENVENELGDALGDDSGTAGGLDGESTDDTSDNTDSGGDQGDLGMDAEAGSDDEPLGGDDLAADDTVSEDASGVEPSSADATSESADDVGTDETSEGTDMDSVDSTDGSDLDDETPLEGAEPVSDEVDVTEEVEQQNEAADVTAEAASSDAEQTDFIAGDTPEQHGVEPEGDVVPNDGEEVVAEATPSVQNTEDVSTANANQDISNPTVDDVELDDDVPLDVDATQDLTPKEVDGESSDGATVEESTTDQEATALDETTDATETTEVEEPVVEETTDEPVIDEAAGEIEETESEADLEKGELDIPDVDTDTTEEEVEEAEVEADEVEAEADAEDVEGDRTDKTIEELQKEQEALEEFKQVLEYAIAHESFEPGLLGYINGKTNDIRKKLNVAGFGFTEVSLESYGAKDLDLAYVASLESVRGMLSRFTGLTAALSQKIEKFWAKGLVEKVTKRADALNKQIDLCLVELKDSSMGTTEVNGVGAYLAHADGHLVKAVSDDLKLTTDIGGKGFKASEDLQNQLVKALNDIISATTVEEATGVAKQVAGFKDIKSAFPASVFTKGFLGGNKLVIKEAGAGTELAERITNMARRAVPVVVKDGKGTNSTQKLSKGDVANLLKMAKAYVALATKLAGTTGERAVSSVSKIRLTRERALPFSTEGRLRGGDEKAIDATASAMELIAKSHNDLYKFVTKHCIDVADALCGVAKKAIK